MADVKEVKVNICGEDVEFFFYEGFFEFNSASSPFHSHDYAEVHFTVDGECRIYTENEILESCPCRVTFIPKGVVHRLKMEDGKTRHNTFFIKSDCRRIIRKNLPEGVLSNLIEEIEKSKETGCFDKVAISLMYICKDLLDFNICPTDLEDREFIIREFFADRYNEDVTLSDLSKKLKLSNKHSARLVEKYMNDSFSNLLTKYRIRAANLLMKTDETLTLAEIAEMVGYGSYSGFWKAFRKLN